MKTHKQNFAKPKIKEISEDLQRQVMENLSRGPVQPEDPPKKEKPTVVEEVAEELKVNLPHVNLPLPLKLIALLTLVGGLSSLGSAVADIFSPEKVTMLSYILRLAAGLGFIFISYGIIKRQNWSTWLYGAMVIVALFINWPLAILPALIIFYMYFNRKYFYPSIFDNTFNKISASLARQLK